MITCRSRAPRGVTLVELLVALAVGGIVLAALFGVVQSQQRAFYQGHLQRAAQGSARSALLFIEQRLEKAGWGMDAPLAFDFDRYPALPCPALAAPCVRDSVNGNDELIFYERNSHYWVPAVANAEPVGKAWRITGLAGDTLTVNARQGDRFVKGQVLQAICNGAAAYAYFTVGTSTATLPGPASVPIALAPSSANDPFRRQAIATDPCFTDGTARLFQIDRYRFHVRPVQVGTDVQPYLVLDQGLDANGDGPDDAEEVIVAEGIELFQVGYVMTNTALAPRGTLPGTPILFAQGFPGLTAGNNMTTLAYPGALVPGQSEYLSTSWYGYSVGPPAATNRLTDHQANIRAVQLAIVSRSPQQEPDAPRGNQLTPVLNLNVLPAWINPNAPWARNRVETTLPVRNMTVRGTNNF